MLVLPLLGNSSRFREVGINKPKYLLPIAGKSVLHWVIKSFRRITTKIVILYRSDQVDPREIEKVCEVFPEIHFEISGFDSVSRGQAESVYFATKKIPEESFLVFNGDSFFDSELSLVQARLGSNFISHFSADGNHWSFVKKDSKNRITMIKEKERISDLCSNGLYGFRSSNEYNRFFERIIIKEKIEKEIYVSQVLQEMIESKIIFTGLPCSSKYVSCGTPAEIEESRKGFHAY